MICKECNAEMRKDDVDKSFDGCMDVYWECDHCQTCCKEKIRFNQSWKEIWHSENGDVAKDYEIVNKIQRPKKL